MKLNDILTQFSNAAARRIAYTTEQCYRTWICKFVDFLTTREARALEASEAKIELFLSGMARDDYSAVSQLQAFNAILFLYRPQWRAPDLDTPI